MVHGPPRTNFLPEAQQPAKQDHDREDEDLCPVASSRLNQQHVGDQRSQAQNDQNEQKGIEQGTHQLPGPGRRTHTDDLVVPHLFSTAVRLMVGQAQERRLQKLQRLYQIAMRHFAQQWRGMHDLLSGFLPGVYGSAHKVSL